MNAKVTALLAEPPIETSECGVPEQRAARKRALLPSKIGMDVRTRTKRPKRTKAGPIAKQKQKHLRFAEVRGLRKDTWHTSTRNVTQV